MQDQEQETSSTIQPTYMSAAPTSFSTSCYPLSDHACAPRQRENPILIARWAFPLVSVSSQIIRCRRPKHAIATLTQCSQGHPQLASARPCLAATASRQATNARFSPERKCGAFRWCWTAVRRERGGQKGGRKHEGLGLARVRLQCVCACLELARSEALVMGGRNPIVLKRSERMPARRVPPPRLSRWICLAMAVRAGCLAVGLHGCMGLVLLRKSLREGRMLNWTSEEVAAWLHTARTTTSVVVNTDSSAKYLIVYASVKDLRPEIRAAVLSSCMDGLASARAEEAIALLDM